MFLRGITSTSRFPDWSDNRVPPGGHFNLNFADFGSDDYLGKYLADFNEISHRCSLSGCPNTSRFSDWSDNTAPPSGRFNLKLTILFLIIISECTWWNFSMKFHIDVPQGNMPAPVDFRTGQTTRVPPSGHFNLKLTISFFNFMLTILLLCYIRIF